MAVLPKIVVGPVLSTETVVVDPSRLVLISNLSYTPIIRVAGSLAGCAFALSSFYNWELGRDEEGTVVLVPLKKEG